MNMDQQTIDLTLLDSKKKTEKLPARDKIILSFRSLVMNKDFEKLTVAEISEAAGVSRKTFYQHFQDKNDIVEQIVLTNILSPMSDLRKLYMNHDLPSGMVLEWLYQQFFDDREFYIQISEFTGQNSFQQLILQETSVIIAKKVASLEMSDIDKEYMIYFYASSHTMLLLKWIRDGMKLAPKQIAGYYEQWTLPVFQQINSSEER